MEKTPATSPTPTMMGVSTEVLEERPWRAVRRARYQAFHFWGRSDVQADRNAENASGARGTMAATISRGMYSDQFKTLSGPSSSMSEETHQAHAARATKSKARSHVIPRRSGSGSRRAVRGGVFAAPRAPFSPPHRNTPATASQTAGIDEAPTWGATWENFPCPPNTSENSGTNVTAESSVPTTAPTTATTASWASTTTPTLRGPTFASCHSA